MVICLKWLLDCLLICTYSSAHFWTQQRKYPHYFLWSPLHSRKLWIQTLHSWIVEGKRTAQVTCSPGLRRHLEDLRFAWEILWQTCSFSYKEHNCKQNGMRIRLNNTMYAFFSVLVDVKTGWKVGNWPLIQPRHCQQRDGYNCGVSVCLVSFTVNFV